MPLTIPLPCNVQIPSSLYYVIVFDAITLVGILSSSFSPLEKKILHPLMIMLPNSFYKVPYLAPLIKTIAPLTIFHVSFSNIICTPASLIFLIDIIFLARPGIFKTLGRILILPSFSNKLTLPCPMILDVESYPRNTSPLLYFSYSQNHSL